MRLGFACAWAKDEEATWSGTPWHLLTALRRRIEVQDLGPRLHPLERRAWQAAYVTRDRGRWRSAYPWSRTFDAVTQARVRSGVRRTGVDCLLQVQDLAAVDVPYLCYQDLSLAALERHWEELGERPSGFPGLGPRALQRRLTRQRRLYDGAARLLTMSRWLADSLVQSDRISPERVAVVHPGVNIPLVEVAPLPRVGPQRVLFVGRDFLRKGGDVVVQAVQMLRDSGAQVELDVVGPLVWPLDGPPPAYVRFYGQVHGNDLTALYGRASALVLPSRFEAFGICLAEAACYGVPSVARARYAMSEVVQDGVNGRLIDDLDTVSLAEALGSVLEDGDMRETCRRGIGDARRYWSWDRAAAQVISLAEGAVGA